MQHFLFKPDNYETWSITALDKIQRTIDSCITLDHIDAAKNMVDNFVLMLALNETYPDDDVQDISKQLYLYLKLKQGNLYE
jgi:hypothetical protein